MYERKRLWMNHHGDAFLDFSYLSGADNDGDGRSVVPADFRNTGQLDLLVRLVGGPDNAHPLLLYENHFPPRHYLKVSLRGDGKRSNRQGIGARLIAEAGELKMTREMYPYNSNRAQNPSIAHFGLGDATRVDRLTIRWPSGEKQVLTNLKVDRHIVVTEGKSGEAAVETVVPGKIITP
jgi:hypothetical protein